MEPDLQQRLQGGAAILADPPGGWRLEIPPGPRNEYRWAQLDDYMGLRRQAFQWSLHHSGQTLHLELRARASAADAPGTWGFGFWNDPFSLGTGLGGTTAHLPALPNAAWFFYAAPPNYLSFRDDRPAQGFLAATFAAPRFPALAMAPAALALPLLAVRPAARLLRRAAARIIAEDSALMDVDVTQWHSYRLDWRQGQVSFWVDGAPALTTRVSPRGPLGLVIWVDNQYAAFPPSGQVAFGTSANAAAAWLEVAALQVLREG